MKIKYIFLLLICTLILSGTTQAQDPKIGYTNVELILMYMPETQRIEQELSTLEKKLSESLEVKQRYYQQMMLEYLEKQQQGTLTPDQEKTYQMKITELQQEIQTSLAMAEQQLLKRRMELLNPLTEKIQKAIDDVAKEGGFSYIINQSIGSGVPSILYGDASMDVTLLIAKKLGISIDDNSGK